MDHSNDQRRLREELEVRHPADFATSPELARALADDPQLRLAFERIQRWDGAIGEAMDHVDLPAGLEQRILARVTGEGTRLAATPTLSGSVAAAVNAAASSTDPAAGSLNAASTETANDISPEPASRRVRPLAYWSGIGAAAVTAAALVVAAGYWLQFGSDVEIDQLAQQWQTQLQRKDWQPIGSAPAEFPYPEAMRVAATHWQWIGKLTPTPVVAYHLTDGKTTALLYAARMTREGLATAPRPVPQHDTGGRAIGWWRAPRQQSLVYVLVVDDDKQYGALVGPASTPLAVLLPLRFDTQPADETRRTALARKIA